MCACQRLFCCLSVPGGQPGIVVYPFKCTRDESFTTSAGQGGSDFQFNCALLSLLVPTHSQSAGHFQTLLAKSPPLPVAHGATRAGFSGSHVIRQHQRLALWLHSSTHLAGLLPRPVPAGDAHRFSGAQDSKTAPLLSKNVIATGLPVL